MSEEKAIPLRTPLEEALEHITKAYFSARP
jgi:hypothetical protein